MQLIAPPGYGAVAPFDKEKHAGLGFSATAPASFVASLNAIYVTAMEFTQCARHYPIVFSYNEEQHRYAPMIVTSFISGHNSFVNDAGEWDATSYIPAYVRRYPFCTVEVNDADTASQPMVCVEERALEEKAEAFFDAEGNASDAWVRMETFMNEYEAARRVTDSFLAVLARHELFEVFEAQAYSHTGKHYHMGRMYRVNEKKLQNLSAEVLSELIEKKYMYYIYAHLVSLDNFQHLLDRSVTH